MPPDMDAGWALTAVAAGIAIYTALCHGLLFRLRPQEREHLWLAVAAAGVAGVSGAIAMLYGSSDPARSEFWQRVMLACASAVLVGFLRFSCRFLRVEVAWLERAALLFSIASVGLVAATPWVFGGTPVVRHLPWGRSFVESGLDPVGQVLLAGFLVFFAAALLLYARHIRGADASARILFLPLCLWFATGVNDGAVAVGLYDFPYLHSVGFLVVVLALSGLLLRRFAVSVGSLEHMSERLHTLVEERTDKMRQQELQLAHGEQLATIGTLAASVAHEINNPIAFVHSNLNRLAELWAKPEPQGGDEVAEILDECREGTERVRVIVTELLNLARRSDGHEEPVDLAAVVESVLPVVRPLARYRAALTVERGEVPRVKGDPRLLGQVVLNLVLNALEAIPEGRVHDNRVTVSTAYEDGSVWLVVADSGSGIPEELLPRIFDAFVTSKEGGTGLGLAVSEKIVTHHGGRIEVQSDRRGTRMIVEFPPAALCDDA
jgi:signal transduction histidine kinase